MHSPLAIAYAALLIVLAVSSVWLATLDFRRGRFLSKQETPSWPLEFPVYWLDYYLGPRFAKYLRVGQLLVLAPMMAFEAYDALVRDQKPQGMLLVYLAGVLTLVIRTYVPKICRIDDTGIRFEQYYHWEAIRRLDETSVRFEQLYRWEAIRRYKINERRLLFVAERRDVHHTLSHIEIPLNGLSAACRALLAEQLDARLGQAAAASQAT